MFYYHLLNAFYFLLEKIYFKSSENLVAKKCCPVIFLITFKISTETYTRAKSVILTQANLLCPLHTDQQCQSAMVRYTCCRPLSKTEQPSFLCTSELQGVAHPKAMQIWTTLNVVVCPRGTIGPHTSNSVCENIMSKLICLLTFIA